MKKQLLTLFIVAAAGFSVPAAQADSEARIAIGQPTIFWHNNEWQTYKDGVWTPYFQTGQTSRAEPEETAEPADVPQPGNEETNSIAGEDYYYPMYLGGGGHIRRPHPGRHDRHHRIGDRRHETTPTQQSNVAIGQRAPDLASEQTTIGIGQPNITIGPNNLQIGPPNLGIGPPNLGIASPNLAIGARKGGIAQPNLAMGQPNGTIGQTTIGIGQRAEPAPAPAAHAAPPPAAHAPAHSAQHHER